MGKLLLVNSEKGVAPWATLGHPVLGLRISRVSRGSRRSFPALQRACWQGLQRHLLHSAAQDRPGQYVAGHGLQLGRDGLQAAQLRAQAQQRRRRRCEVIKSGKMVVGRELSTAILYRLKPTSTSQRNFPFWEVSAKKAGCYN